MTLSRVVFLVCSFCTGYTHSWTYIKTTFFIKVALIVVTHFVVQQQSNENSDCMASVHHANFRSNKHLAKTGMSIYELNGD